MVSNILTKNYLVLPKRNSKVDSRKLHMETISNKLCVGWIKIIIDALLLLLMLRSGVLVFILLHYMLL